MDSIEDDKLDFGDLDDLDIPQDGLGDGFTGEIEDMAELERELGLDDFDDISAQPSTIDTLSSTNSGPSKKVTTEPSLEKTNTPPFTTNESNKHTSPSSRTSNTSLNNSKPFVARSKLSYQSNTHHYNPYNNNNQQPRFQNMPYPGMTPFNMIPMAGTFGQGFMNMGLPMMGNNNNMPNVSVPNRRIHVNPKFAAAHPPPPQSNDQPKQESPQRRIMEQQQRSEPVERQKKEEQEQHNQGNQRKRPAEFDNLTDNSQQSPFRRRLDTAPESTRPNELSTSASLQSRLGRRNVEIPVKREDTIRNTNPSPSRPSSGNGFSIRGAAAAAAAFASSDARLSTPSKTQQDRTKQLSGNQPTFSIQGRSSGLHGISSNGNLPITSRLNTNNQRPQQRLPTNHTNNEKNTKDPILQRLGEGRITKNTKKTDRPTPDRQSPRATSNSSSNDTLTPIFANGKSSKLIVSNLPPKVTEFTLKSLEPKDIKVVSLDRGNKNAILLFAGIDSAVTFRRKYNRTTLDGEHISVNFAKN